MMDKAKQGEMMNESIPELFMFYCVGDEPYSYVGAPMHKGFNHTRQNNIHLFGLRLDLLNRMFAFTFALHGFRLRRPALNIYCK